MTVASEQKATTGVPSMRPTAASMPLSSSGVISSSEPSSRSAASRRFGLRGSCSRGGLAAGPGPAPALLRERQVPSSWGLLEGSVRRCGRRGRRCGRRSRRSCSAPRVALGKVALAGGDVEADVLGVVEVDRRRNDAVVEREHRRHRLERAGGTEQVAGHRLGGGDDHLAGGLLTERLPDRQRLGEVALRRRGGVGVDVHDVGRLEAGVGERLLHRPGGAGAGRGPAGRCRGSRR